MKLSDLYWKYEGKQMENEIKEMLDILSKSFNDYYHSKCKFKNFEDNKLLEDYVKMKVLDARISELRLLKNQLSTIGVNKVIDDLNMFDMRENILVKCLQGIESENKDAIYWRDKLKIISNALADIRNDYKIGDEIDLGLLASLNDMIKILNPRS